MTPSIPATNSPAVGPGGATIVPAGFRLFYVDDSGAPDTGFITYSWIEVTPGCWSPGLRRWLDLRKQLYTDFGVGADRELHAVEIHGGRTRGLSSDPAVDRSKARRRDLLEVALKEISANPYLAHGTVYRRTNATGSDYAKQREAVYDELLTHLDHRLAAAGEYGQIQMDGNGTDPTYLRVHRRQKLADRRIIEDPMFQASHVSQWVQVADIVAWTTYQHLLQHPGKARAAAWYEAHLRARDVNGAPVVV